MTEGFNPEMMVLGRTLCDMNQSDLAEATGKTQAYVSKVERRVLPASEDFIKSLSKELNFPKSFFFQPGEMAGVPSSVHAFFRETTPVTTLPKVKVLDRLNAEISIRVLHLRIIKDRLTPHINKFDAVLNAIKPEPHSPKEAAYNFREYHHIISGPIENLTSLVEASGILVFPCDFGQETNEEIDGVSMNIPHLPPTIFLNKNRTADRMRFSLAHELFHVLAHRVPSATMEEEANKFAAELLMPEQDIRSDLSMPITILTLAALKPKWKASIAALLYRAGDLKILNQAQKNNLWRHLSRQGWRKREPASLDLKKETISLVQDLFYSDPEEDLSGLLHVNRGRIEEMYQTKYYDLI